jgi:hypothetical protein
LVLRIGKRGRSYSQGRPGLVATVASLVMLKKWALLTFPTLATIVAGSLYKNWTNGGVKRAMVNSIRTENFHRKERTSTSFFALLLELHCGFFNIRSISSRIAQINFLTPGDSIVSD